MTSLWRWCDELLGKEKPQVHTFGEVLEKAVVFSGAHPQVNGHLAVTHEHASTTLLTQGAASESQEQTS